MTLQKAEASLMMNRESMATSEESGASSSQSAAPVSLEDTVLALAAQSVDPAEMRESVPRVLRLPTEASGGGVPSAGLAAQVVDIVPRQSSWGVLSEDKVRRFLKDPNNAKMAADSQDRLLHRLLLSGGMARGLS